MWITLIESVIYYMGNMNRYERESLITQITSTNKNTMWKITYRDEDGLKEVFIQAPTINMAIDKYDEQFSFPIIAIDHKPEVEFIS